MRPSRLRDEIARARAYDQSIRRSTTLPPNWVLNVLPRDILIEIATWLPPADLARLCAVARAFFGHDTGTGECCIVEAALRARAAVTGLQVPQTAVHASEWEGVCTFPPSELVQPPSWVRTLLADEVLRTLRSTLVTMADGCKLRLSCFSKTGYEGVSFMPWRAPWAYRAEADGMALGSFNSAVAAAVAVAQYRFVQDHPYL